MTEKPPEPEKPSRNYVDAASQTPRENMPEDNKRQSLSPKRALAQVN